MDDSRPSQLATGSRGALRKLLGCVLRTDGDIESFCLDFFFDVHARFSGGMDRLSKVNLLLQLQTPEVILARLRQHNAAAVAEHAALLDEETPRARHIQTLAAQFESLLAEKELLLRRGADITELNTRILAVRRAQREGPQLEESEVLSGRYRLLERIGRGGFASVWQAYDLRRQQLVAVKVLHADRAEDPSARQRFQRGARRMAELSHPHIARVLTEPLEDQGFHFFVMEYLPGGDLGRAMQDGRLAPSAALSSVLQAGAALHHAHEQGLIHRDVKPSNVLLDATGAARLTDFDLILARDTTGGTRDGGLGTILYAAPEALEDAANVDRRADVYSLGMTALCALLGREPPLRELMQRRERLIDKLGCATALKPVLKKALSWEPTERHETAESLCTALREALAVPELPTSSRPHDPSEDWLRVKIDENHYAHIRLSEYSTLQAFLQGLWYWSLRDRFELDDYARTWVLHEPNTERLILPWSYLLELSTEEHALRHQGFLSQPPDALQLTTKSVLQIAAAPLRVFGLAVDDPELLTRVSTDKNQIEPLLRSGELIEVSPDKPMIERYTHRHVFKLPKGIPLRDHQALVQGRSAQKS